MSESEAEDAGTPAEVHFSPRLRWFMRLFGMGPGRTWVVLTAEELRVRAGGFRVTVPRASIQAAGTEKAPWWAQAGVHTDLRGRWIINAGRGPLVRMDLSAPAHGSMFGFEPTIERLDLGLEDGAAFIAQLGADGTPQP